MDSFIGGGSGVEILGNTIQGGNRLGFNPAGLGAGQNGISVEGSNNATIARNHVNAGLFSGSVGLDGIHVTDSDNVTIGGAFLLDGNVVTAAGDDGIDVTDGEDVNVSSNVVSLSGDNGVEISGIRRLGVNTNVITGASGDGIHVNNVMKSMISGNVISFTGDDAIDANFMFGTLIAGNIIIRPNGDGIALTESALAAIGLNLITGAGDDGIDVEDSGFVAIAGNQIKDSGNSGISLDNTNFALITRNNVGGAGYDGINVWNGAHVLITHNDVDDIGHDGIGVSYGNDILIKKNHVTNVGNDGIYAGDMDSWNEDGEPNVRIVRNTVDWTGSNGIAVSNVYSSLIDGNEVGLDGEGSIGAAGIYVTNESYDDPTTITGNLVANTDDEGIYVDGVAEVTISGNTVWNTNYDGIAVYDAWDNVLISDNYVGAARGEIGGGFIDGDGIYVSDSGSIWITDNVVAETSDDGIEVRNIDFAEIDMNRVLNSSANGFHAGGIYNGTVILAGNTFTDNAIGALFEGGLIDLTGEANTFNGGDIGMRFDPAALYEGYFLALKEDTIGTTMFNGQSQYYVELLDGALFNPGTPTIINGLDATYDGFRPSSVGGVLTQAQYDALEGKIFHYNDQSDLGLFFFGLVPSQIDQEDIYNRFAGFTPGNNGFRMTILGLPGVGGNGGRGGNGGAGNLAGFLANIAPAAGGNGGNGGEGNSLGGAMENIEPAAGGSEETSCWADAMNSAFSGKTVSYSFGSSPEEALSDTAACSASAG